MLSSTRLLPGLTSIQELASALQSAQPKIQKMCEEESDDQEAVAKLFEINDSIHRTIERYKLIKKGDLEGASKIPKGTLGTSTGVSKTADNELSLIDFGGDAEPSSNTSNQTVDAASEQKPASIEDDLLGLSMSDQNYGQSGGIALGFGANSSMFEYRCYILSECDSNQCGQMFQGPHYSRPLLKKARRKQPHQILPSQLLKLQLQRNLITIHFILLQVQGPTHGPQPLHLPPFFNIKYLQSLLNLTQTPSQVSRQLLSPLFPLHHLQYSISPHLSRSRPLNQMYPNL